MPTANEYRNYAKLCSDLAEAASDEIERGILEQIATQFRRIANRKDKKESDQAPQNSN
jgi:hypothetical protein